MTTTDLIAVVRRRWYVAILGVVVTALVALVIVQRPAVWSTQVDVVLVPPTLARDADTTLVNTSDDMIAAAGLLERRVNANRPQQAVTTQDVGLVGTGVRRGTQVRQPNDGGQWTWFYTRPILSVQVAGPSQAEVAAEQQRLIARIGSTLSTMQIAADVPVSQRITYQLSPTDPAIVMDRGHPGRAALAVLALGMALTLLGLTQLDRMILARRRRSAAVPARRLETASVA